eukprot:10367044-Heterocapsa_arctica.AAC.1
MASRRVGAASPPPRTGRALEREAIAEHRRRAGAPAARVDHGRGRSRSARSPHLRPRAPSPPRS